MNSIKIIRTLLILSLLTTMSYWGYLTYKHAKQYEVLTNKISKECDANALAAGKIDQITEIISLGLVKNKSKSKLRELSKKQEESKESAQKYLSFYMGNLLLILILTFTCTLRGGAMILSFSTFISLIFGLINPILMVTIHKKIEYLGDVILSFESKGILGSISKLFESGELAVAITILLFSVLLPLLKSITLTFTLIFYKHEFSYKLVNFFKQIGKWSMIDVFVVATFLVYLTSNGKGVSKAEIQVGLYFFLTYVILSMITAIQTQKVLKKNNNPILLKN